MTTTYSQEDMISFANYCKHYGSLDIKISQFNSWKEREERLSKIINNEFQKQEWENSLPSDSLEKKEEDKCMGVVCINEFCFPQSDYEIYLKVKAATESESDLEIKGDYIQKKERILKKMKEAGGKAGEKLKGTVRIIPQERMEEILDKSKESQYDLLHADKFEIKIKDVESNYPGVIMYNKDTNLIINAGNSNLDQLFRGGKVGFGVLQSNKASRGISEEMKNTLLELQKKYSPGFTPFKGFDK